MDNNFKIKNRKVYKMSLTTLSPIFINSGEVINKSSYVYNSNNGVVSIVDNKKLISVLEKNNKFNSFLGKCIYGDFNLTDFFKKENMKNYLNLDIFNYSLKTYSNIVTQEVKRNNEIYDKLNDINAFMKSSNGLPYIPGSSIKGAIRTAIIYGEILNNKNDYYSIFNKFLKTEPNSKEARKIGSSIDETILKSKIDIFKNISVSDTNEAGLNNLYISRRHDVVTNKNVGHDLPIFMEVLRAGIKFNFTLTVDKPYSIEDLCKYFDDLYDNNVSNDTFYRDYSSIATILQEKIDENNKYPLYELNNTKPNIFIGGVNEKKKKSIIYAVRKKKNDNSEIKRDEIVNYIKRYFDKKFTSYNKKLGEKAPLHNHVKIDEKISPRSLRLVKNSKDNFVGLGMCKIKVEKELC